MSLEPQVLAALVSGDCGLQFEGRFVAGTRHRIVELHPAGVPALNTFTVRAEVGWRSVAVTFVPGAYAGDFIRHMAAAEEDARSSCSAVLAACMSDGASVTLRINGAACDPKNPAEWGGDWSRLELGVRRGQLELGNGDNDNVKIAFWVLRATAAIVTLLPLEEYETYQREIPPGFSEGDKYTAIVNRYERDRRNRAAAIAIHGFSCAGCELVLRSRYGDAAADLIEIHHTMPVSKLGPGYKVDPATDLVPLCPNCHRVAHRRDPPYSPAELRAMVAAGQRG